MPSIKYLPEHLINQIAAGEVVERPASVVKELIENALDAKSTHITIEIQNGGDEFISITDDGIGMDKEDATMAFERHATSKIATTQDLFKIHTLGFRGEALASIASVAHVKLITKKRGSLEGTFIENEGGQMKEAKTIGAPEGTRIEVHDLFYNTPARKKYLKTPSTEYQHIVSTVTGLALAFPQIAFKLVHNKHIAFDLPIHKDFLIRIRALVGKSVADELTPVFSGHADYKIEGFIGKPLIARSSRNSQYLFVNRREVKSASLSYAVKESYHSLLPKDKHPVFFLSLHCNPELVDVNVHPRKLEVRFQKEKDAFASVYQACKKALENNFLAPKIQQGDKENYYQERFQKEPFPDKGQVFPNNEPQNIQLREKESFQYAGSGKPFQQAKNTVQAALQFTENFGTALKPGDSQNSVQNQLVTNSKHENLQNIIPLAQLANSYILCQQGKNLIIVDQHAAHERIRYTEILQEFENTQVAIQPLLSPLNLELPLKEQALVQENQEILKKLGFEIEAFGGNTYAIQAIPSYLAKEDLHQTLLGLLDDLEQHSRKGDFEKRKERSLTYMACRSAVKFGDPLAPEEQKALIQKLVTLDLPFTCPHGRPTIVTMSFEELKKRFGREYR